MYFLEFMLTLAKIQNNSIFSPFITFYCQLKDINNFNYMKIDCFVMLSGFCNHLDKEGIHYW